VLAVLLGYLTVLREPTRQTLIVKSRWSRVGMFPTRNRGNTITGLTVQGTVITDEQVAAILAGAGQLESLYLNGCSFTEEQFARLTTLNSLENLGLATTNLTPSMLSHLKKLPKLRSLELTGATIDDAHLAEIGNLLGLEQLNLTGTNITDAGLVELEPLQNLTWLMLPTLSVTPGGTERLQQALPKANIIGPMALQTLPADPSQQNFEEAAETSESP
jgi:Leucine-rich repeat (LRR) protein